MRSLLRSLAPDHVRRRRGRDRAVPARARWPRTGTTSTPTARTAASRSRYDHPDLEEILGPTFGLMIYQEQLMRVVAEARRATRSKRPTTSARRPARRSASSSRRSARSSSTGASRNGHSARVRASAYFDTIEPFADYSFNKSHSVGYGLITYQTAWLKANHPVAVLRRAAHERQDATSTRPRSTSTSAASSTSPCSYPT